MADLVGDRFLVGSDTWLDLATGCQVAGRILPARSAVVDCHSAVEAHAVWRNGVVRLIDFGSSPDGGWFEVWNRRLGDGAPLYDVRHLARPVVAAIVRCAEGHAGRGPRCLTIDTAMGAGTGSVVSDTARALRDLGFVVVRADLWLPRRLRRRLCHRHLVVIDTWRARRAGATAAWLADLVAVSNRAHLVLSIRAAERGRTAALSIRPLPVTQLAEAFVPGSWRPSPVEVRLAATASDGWPGRFTEALDALRGRFAGAGLVREHSPIAPGSVRAFGPAAPSHSRLLRADALARRGRVAAASRWYRSAFHAARRRADAGASLAAFRAAAQPWREGVAPAHVARMAADLLARLAAPVQRIEVASLAGRALVAAGTLNRGEAFLSVAESIVQAAAGEVDGPAVALPAAFVIARAELRFWQGQFVRGLRELDEAPAPGTERWVWGGLLGWGAHDRAALARAVAALPTATPGDDADVHSTAWRLTLDVLATSALGNREVFAGAVRAFETWCASNRHADAARLCRASILAAGSAKPVADGPHAGPGDSVVALLGAWLARLDAPVSDAVRRAIRRAILVRGAAGIWRWAEGRTPVGLIEGLPALFEIVHEGGDEAAALERACEWVKRSTRAVRAGIFAAEGAPCLGGDRDAVAGLSPERALEVLACGRVAAHVEQGTTWVVAPVRYCGATIGTAAARGVTSDVVSLAEGVQALASSCAPLVRARLDLARLAAGADALTGSIIGTSPVVAAVRAAAARAAAAPFPVLIEGESGTGKELVARALHRLGPRRDRRFCARQLRRADRRAGRVRAVRARARRVHRRRGPAVGPLRGGAPGHALPRRSRRAVAARAGQAAARAPGRRDPPRRRERRPGRRRAGRRRHQPIARQGGARPVRSARICSFGWRSSASRCRRCASASRIFPLLAQHFWKEATQRTGSRAILGPEALAALCRHVWPGNVRELQNVLAAWSSPRRLAAASPRGISRACSTRRARMPPDSTWRSTSPADGGAARGGGGARAARRVARRRGARPRPHAPGAREGDAAARAGRGGAAGGHGVVINRGTSSRQTPALRARRRAAIIAGCGGSSSGACS